MIETENRSVIAGETLREQGVVAYKGITHGNFQYDGTVLCNIMMVNT